MKNRNTGEGRRRNEAMRLSRLAARLTFRELAESCGRSHTFYHRVESGGSALLTRDHAERIAKVLGMPMGILFPNIDDEGGR